MKEYITTNVNNIANNLFPCLKQEVRAMLVTEDGNEYFGANWMLNNTITVCPRLAFESGTRYDLCESICGQGPDYHAERNAIYACIEADDTAVGATLYLTGHTYCCKDCQAAIKNANIATVIIVDTGEVINVQEQF